jgi:hypothetical protein
VSNEADFPDLDPLAIAAGIQALQETVHAHPSVQVVAVVAAVFKHSQDARALLYETRRATEALSDLDDRAERDDDPLTQMARRYRLQ